MCVLPNNDLFEVSRKAEGVDIEGANVHGVALQLRVHLLLHIPT
jgi:hypothetical protein